MDAGVKVGDRCGSLLTPQCYREGIRFRYMFLPTNKESTAPHFVQQRSLHVFKSKHFNHLQGQKRQLGIHRIILDADGLFSRG